LKTDMTNCDLSGADLTGTEFIDVKLDGAITTDSKINMSVT